jgi:uncharacterized NAD(P)/FAD-binding protein YdhS
MQSETVDNKPTMTPSHENKAFRSGEWGIGFRPQLESKTVIIVGGGVAGSEVGTYLGHTSTIPLRIVEIEREPTRQFGGWGFQSFPATETTNLAMRKMYLGNDPEEIHNWAREFIAANRAEFGELAVHRDRPFPRVLMREYVRWRRSKIDNDLVHYDSVFGEAMRVGIGENPCISVELADGRVLKGDRVVMASGSISVKVPDYLRHLAEHPNVIIDPLIPSGHERRGQIPPEARVLILGTGLTGEEQVNVLLKSGHTNLTLLSRGGLRHYGYPRDQRNVPLTLVDPPTFLLADTAEEFHEHLTEFFAGYLSGGHSQEDIWAAVRPHWEKMRADLGGCVKAADRIRNFRRVLATNSIGTSWEVSENLGTALNRGDLAVERGYISRIDEGASGFTVHYSDMDGGLSTHNEVYDYIINAVGRNIIRHPLWDHMFEDGLAKKHAGIGVQVSETGQLIDAAGVPSNLIWVVGMPRAGDHALRRGYLGNTAFNVPQVRSHVYDTAGAMLDGMTEESTARLLTKHNLNGVSEVFDTTFDQPVDSFSIEVLTEKFGRDLGKSCAENSGLKRRSPVMD